MEPERSVLHGEDAGLATEEFPQRRSHHPATQRTRCNFLEIKCSNCQANHGQSEKGLETQEEEEESGPNGDSQSKDPGKTKESSNKAREQSGVSDL